MTDKEKIRAEVERLEKEWRWHSSIESKYRCEAYRELLEFIDSPHEEPVSEDLEEETIKKYIQEHLVSHETLYKGTIDELEVYEPYDLMLIAKWAAKQQKQQMMKDAVVGHVSTMYNDMLRATTRLMDKNIQEKLGIKFGDTVKLIIVKED